MRQGIATILAVGWLVSHTLHAQSDWADVQKLAVGTSLRISAASRKATGAVASVSDVELALLTTAGGIARFQRSEIELIETFVSRPHPKRRGALKGALWGALILIPGSIAARMGGADGGVEDVVAACVFICGGAALGALLADHLETVVVYRR